MPTACAAIPIRPPSRVAIATAEALVLLVQEPVRTDEDAVQAESAVDDELSPSFSSSRVTSTWSPSTRKAETPLVPSSRGRCARRARNVPAWLPFVNHCLAPSSRQPRLARGGRAERAGVGARARLGEGERAEHSPAASGGTKRCRCSSVPKARIGSVAALVCTATVTPTPASARDSSSSTSMYERKSAPAPPSSSGTQTPSSPSSPSFATTSRGSGARGPTAAACGTISASANSRASAWIARCSGVEREVHRPRV